ncbi:MAG: ComF family protein [Pseudohongiellaceae bacterium]
MRELIAAYKFHGRFAEGYVLAKLLSTTMRDHYSANPDQRPQRLIPVPLHRTRLQERGFNQAAELAKTVSRDCAIPVGHRYVERIRHTAAQSSLTGADRRHNLRDAFSITSSEKFHGIESVAVIDDVVTTGSTVIALAETLRAVGVDSIDIWALARAPGKL